MTPDDRRTVDAEREPNFLLAGAERRVLRTIAGRLPRWVLPDDLTALGVLSALGICAAYVLSNYDPAWLWVASGLLVVHWLGDSLDGTLARVRGIQRPRYGYYLAPGGVHFTVGQTRFTPLDLVGIAIAAVMIVLLLARAGRNLRELARLEPAASRRG